MKATSAQSGPQSAKKRQEPELPSTPAREAAERVARKLREQSFQAYFVGGCVRDLLRGVEPKDYDVVTDARPEQVVELFPRALLVGAQFGVVGVLEGEYRVEVATFRNDGLYSDGRRPDEVRYTRDPREDVLRRDFTVNGLLLDPLTGEVLDFVGGKKDLEQRCIRAIGNPEKRFEEDRLRMLRAVRFATCLESEIAPETFEAIRRLAHKITEVSAERVRDELLRILQSGYARRGFELLEATNLLDKILPEISAMKGVEQPPEFHPEGDVWTHTLLMLEQLKNDCSPTLALGVLLHDVGKPPTFRVAPDRIRFDNHVPVGMRMAEEICRRLRLSQDQTAQVVSLVEHHLRFRDTPRMRLSTLKRFLRMEKFEEHLELHRLDCLASHGNLENYDWLRTQLVELPAEQIRPPRLLTGDDLIAMGYRPGPRFKEILQAVEDAQLEGQIRSPEEAAQYVREYFLQ
ncbi:MAG: CCA tRNA nucleotidyltransferase [Acidobacteria bacterium]|nr:CCA tRNA nucleotidyltransferase [Acidobacteriota bacterium]